MSEECFDNDPTQYLIPAAEAADAIDSQERLLRAPVGGMKTEEVFVAWSILDHVEKMAKKRKALLRERLLLVVEDVGQPECNSEGMYTGSQSVYILGGKVVRQAKEKITLNPELIRALLSAKEIPLSAGGSMQFVPDYKKLADLIAGGQIEADELAECMITKRTFALIVGSKNYPGVVRAMVDGGSKDGRLKAPE